MKKTIAIFIILLVVILGITIYKYGNYKNEVARLAMLNSEYEKFTEGEILGTSLITLINKSIDSNKKNNVSLDDKELYIENDTNSIKIEVKFTESDDTFPMESIGRLGSERFMQNYGTMEFKCTQKEYHEKTKIIKYLLFEQI